MGFFTGRTGSLIFDDKPVAKIRDWSLETTLELLSTNTIDSGVNTFTPGLKGATGSATLMYYRVPSGDSLTQTEFTALLGTLMKTGNIDTTSRVLFKLNVGGDEKDDIEFRGYITSASVSVSTGELSVVPINFTMDGDFVDVIEASS